MQGPLDDISTSGPLGDRGFFRKEEANEEETGVFFSLGQVVGSWREIYKPHQPQEGPAWLAALRKVTGFGSRRRQQIAADCCSGKCKAKQIRS